ncbi:MAG TPA: deoxyribose-phosphate aldolase [Anaeromyxobacter sp.]|nr:deoxyribose-phosphate aldolase [Anaeromyxobacter sp.]
MLLTAEKLARLIDISAVRAQHGEREIREMVQRAREHRFIAVHVLPCWVRFLRAQLEGEADILVGAPVGFPSGGHTTAVKVFEARGLVADGVQEMDMVVNIGKLRAGHHDEVREDIRAVVEAAAPVPVKVILEVHHLTPEEIKRGCELAISAHAAFIKTSTGWAPSGATLETVRLITSFVGSAIQVKAAGSVRSLETVVAMLKMGVTRFGINLDSSIEILRECKARPGGGVEVSAELGAALGAPALRSQTVA